jgi:hypothetical protein
MAPNSNDFVTIVSGLPRTGTSMMMSMIEAGGIPALVDNIRQADDDNPKGYYEFEPVKQTKKDPSWLKQASGKVVKMVHLLLLDLPLDYQYRVVFMRRNLDEVIVSQNKMLVRQGKDVGDLSEDRLKQVFAAQIIKVQNYVKQHDAFRVIDVSYNEVMKDAAPHVQRVCEFLGGNLNVQAMMEVADPSLYRNRG